MSPVKLDPLVASVKICEKRRNKYMFSLSIIYIGICRPFKHRLEVSVSNYFDYRSFKNIIVRSAIVTLFPHTRKILSFYPQGKLCTNYKKVCQLKRKCSDVTLKV